MLHISPQAGLPGAGLGRFLGLFHLDADLSRPGRLAERRRDGQHAVLVAGLNLVGIDRLRKRNASAKGTRADFLKQPVPFLVLFGRRLILPLSQS